MSIQETRITCNILDAQLYEEIQDTEDEDSEEQTSGYDYGLSIKLEDIDDNSEVAWKIPAKELQELTGAVNIPNTSEIIRIAKFLLDGRGSENPVSLRIQVNTETKEQKIGLDKEKKQKNKQKSIEELESAASKFAFKNTYIGGQTGPHFKLYPGVNDDDD